MHIHHSMVWKSNRYRAGLDKLSRFNPSPLPIPQGPAQRCPFTHHASKESVEWDSQMLLASVGRSIEHRRPDHDYQAFEDLLIRQLQDSSQPILQIILALRGYHFLLPFLVISGA